MTKPQRNPHRINPHRKKPELKSKPMWNNIKGEMRLYAHEREYKNSSFTTFSTSIGKKNEDGEYDNVYFDVIFKKGEEPNVNEGPFDITIKKGFITLKNYKDGTVHLAVMILEYVIVTDEDEDDDDDDMPF